MISKGHEYPSANQGQHSWSYYVSCSIFLDEQTLLPLILLPLWNLPDGKSKAVDPFSKSWQTTFQNWQVGSFGLYKKVGAANNTLRRWKSIDFGKKPCFLFETDCLDNTLTRYYLVVVQSFYVIEWWLWGMSNFSFLRLANFASKLVEVSHK